MIQLFHKLSYRNLKPINHTLPGILQGLVLGMLLLQVIAYAVGWHHALVNPLDLDYAERWHAYVASQAFPGGDHVTSAYEMPYNVLPYPPISYLVNGWIGRLWGPDLLIVRAVGRLSALTAALLSTVLIFLISRTVGIRLLWSLIASLLFLTSQSAHFFAVSIRPDEMACAVMLLGLYTVVSQRNYWLAGIIFTFALGVKHSFITVPLVIFISLLIKRDIRSLIKFTVGGCLTGLVIIVLGIWMLGPYWWHGSLLQGFHGADPKQMLFFLGEGFNQPVLVIALACLILADFNGPIAIIAASFAASLFLNVIMLVKVGAAGNYFLEPVALAAILVGYVAEKTLGGHYSPRKAAAWALILALLIPSTVTKAIEATHIYKGRKETATAPSSLIELASNLTGPILADNAEIYFDTGHKPFVSPPDLVMAAVDANKINGQPMQEFINQKRFEMIIVHTNWKERRFFPQSWIDSIEKNYKNSGVIDEFITMKPRT